MLHVRILNFQSEYMYMYVSNRLNVYCPECPPGGTIGYPGGQQKKFLPFGRSGRDK